MRMVKSYKTASSRIEKDLYYKFVECCAEKGLAPNAELKKHIEEIVNDRGKQPMERRNEGDFERRVKTASSKPPFL